MSYLPFADTRTSIRYGFAVGKVRVLETRVFGKATYERLLDARTFNEQRRILSDTIYGRYLEGAETPAAVESALNSALDDFYGFLDEANLPPAMVRYFRIRYDFANLKGALKARALGIASDGLFVDLGTIPVDELSGDLGELPAPFGPLAERLEAQEEQESASQEPSTSSGPGAAVSRAVDETSDVQLAHIDFEVDKAMFAELVADAAKSKSRFLKGLAALEIDIANLKVLLRARLAGIASKQLAAMLFDGGTITRENLSELYAMPLADAAARLSRLPVLSGMPSADLLEPGRVDVIADNVVVRYLRAARAVPVGPEPVIAYVLARAAEVTAVRAILIGTLSGTPADKLRARLRDVYV